MAWFPDERVIRLIGPDCLKNLDSEGHAEAMVALRVRQKRKSEIDYIVSQLPDLPNVVGAARTAIPIARGLDEFEAALKSRFGTTLRMRSWQIIGSGELRVRESRTEAYQNADGSSGERKVDAFRVYARIAGTEILNPRNNSISPRFVKALQRLDEAIATVATAGGADSLSAVDRTRIAKLVEREKRHAVDAIGDIQTRKAFLSPVTVATLRTWAAMPDAEMPCIVERSGSSFYVGTSAGRLRIEIPESLGFTVPSIAA